MDHKSTSSKYIYCYEGRKITDILSAPKKLIVRLIALDKALFSGKRYG